MKVVLGILIVFIIFVSCSNPAFYSDDYVDYVMEKVPEFKTVLEVYWWISTNIEYKKDIDLYHMTDYWASPIETLKNKAGDCEDFNILFMFIVNEQFGYIGKLESIKVTNLITNKEIYHAYTKVNGQDYEFQGILFDSRYYIKNIAEYDYWYVLSLATAMGTKDGSSNSIPYIIE